MFGVVCNYAMRDLLSLGKTYVVAELRRAERSRSVARG